MILNSPLNVQIETGNYCNRTCAYCFWGHKELVPVNKPPKIMPIETFTKIISELKTLNVQFHPIAFAAYNEPTIDPLFINRLEILKSENLIYWNITNGTHLTPQIVDYFVNNLDLIARFFVINVPAINPEEYVSYGGGTTHQLHLLKNGLHRLGPYIKSHHINAHITVLGTYNINHNTNYKQIQDEFGKYGYAINQSSVQDRAGTLRPFVNNGINHAVVKDCYKFKGNLYFGLEGNVYLCCHDFYETYTYGNIHEKPLKEIIGSQTHLKIIEKMKSEMCRKCGEATV